jgi:hypothetical protein
LAEPLALPMHSCDGFPTRCTTSGSRTAALSAGQLRRDGAELLKISPFMLIFVWGREASESQPLTYRSLRDPCEQEYGLLFGSGSIEVDRCVLRAGEARRLKRVVDSTR